MLKTVGRLQSSRSLTHVSLSGRSIKQRCEKSEVKNSGVKSVFLGKTCEEHDLWEPLPRFLSATLLNAPFFVQDCQASETAVSASLGGNGFLVNAAGAGYVLLVAYFLFRVLNKRAKRFTTESITRTEETEPEEETDDSKRDMTIFDGLVGILQSGGLAAGLYLFTMKVDAVLLTADLPEQYTAHNIAITVRTIIRGLCYLLTFIFTMNCIGLTGLTIKLAIDPESVNREPRLDRKEKKSELPKISVASDPEEVARAFDEVSKGKSSKQ